MTVVSPALFAPPVALGGALLVDTRMGSLTIGGIQIAGPQFVIGGRAVTDGVENGTTTLTSATAAFTAADKGALLFGPGIVPGTTIVTVSSGTTVVMSVAATATATGVHVKIGGYPCAAWTVQSLVPLWDTLDVRGSDRILPGVVGTIPYARRQTVSKRVLGLVITGFVDQAGTPYSDPGVGLQSNFNYLRANVADPLSTNPGTRAAVLTYPSGATVSGGVTPEGLAGGNQSGPVMLASLTLSLPQPLT